MRFNEILRASERLREAWDTDDGPQDDVKGSRLPIVVAAHESILVSDPRGKRARRGRRSPRRASPDPNALHSRLSERRRGEAC